MSESPLPFEQLDDVPVIDPFARSSIDDWCEELDAARAESWIGRAPFGPVILTYEDANELLRRPERELYQISGERRLFFGDETLDEDGPTSGPIHRFLQEAEGVFTRPESHQRIRNLCMPSFTRAQVDGWREGMREVARNLVAEFAERGKCEFVGDFAARYPPEIFARIAGIPAEDVPVFQRLVDDVGLAWRRPLEPVRARAETAIDGLFEYVGDLIERRQRDLRDDLVSQLIRAEAEGDRLSFVELRGIIVLLIFAGHDNTKNQLSLIVRALVERPDVWRRLADEPAIGLNVVNEGMRLYPTLQDLFRVTATHVAHRGVQFGAELPIHMPIVAANRDPAVFEEPGRFDPDRSNASRQLGFGAGHHFCLGANLARTDMAEALPILARAMPNLRLLEFAEAEGRSNGRRVERLELAFQPVAATTSIEAGQAERSLR